jgi:signal transduction histidine kinase
VGVLTIAVSTILLLAIVFMFRRRVQLQRALDERLRFERVLSEVSADLVHAPAPGIDAEIASWLKGILRPFGLDRAELGLFADDDSSRNRLAAELPFCAAEVRHDRVVRASSLLDLPAEADADRRTLGAAGVQSLLAVPLAAGDRALGFLAVMTLREKRRWSDDMVRGIRLVGDAFAGALSRRDTEAALQSTDSLTSTVLSSLSAQVAVLDREGTVIQASRPWSEQAGEPDGLPPAGTDYLAFQRARAPQDSNAEAIGRAIEAVVSSHAADGDRRLEYARTGSDGERWYEVIVTPLRRPEGGAVIAHYDCTARKRAEAEAQHHREDAVHSARAATLGELAAGLAHELNQPLGAILTNVQAARRLVAIQPPQTELLSEILDDVAADDRRASEVIRRMRALLYKGELEFLPVDLNELIRDVLRLLASDAILRQTRINPQLEPDLPGVVGDRVQLQQVLLNLLINSLEAMRDTELDRRRVIIRTSQPRPPLVQVAVQDQGTGFESHVLGRIYDPFFTTKQDGLGMGLSISRSIVEAHGGRIRAFNNPQGGAIVTVTLPACVTTGPNGPGHHIPTAQSMELPPYGDRHRHSLRGR